MRRRPHIDAITMVPIGRVACEEHDPDRVDWAHVRSEVRLDAGLGEALLGLADYSHVIVVGWLDRIPEELRARRRAYPNGDPAYPLQGALALRGGARPNPISVTVCRLRGIEGDTIRLEGLDLVDGTPVLDVKPYIAHYDSEPRASLPRWAR
ncbi:MAG: TrmO family methyltransferase [Dehalococcoidia bacterium]